MPRLSPSFLLRAKSISPLLTLLLKECRTLPTAINELRWLKNHVDVEYPANIRKHKILHLCKKRSRGVPLQYLLETQPFGDLDILCRPGVLIPR